MKSILIVPLLAAALMPIPEPAGTGEGNETKNTAGTGEHHFVSRKEDDYSDLKILFSDTYRNPNWQVLYETFEEEGAQVFFSDSSEPDPADYDALVLGGGYDIDPAFYGEKNKGSSGIDRNEDLLQMIAAEIFVKAGRPVLGICRGAQILNVCFGGTLHQDMEGHKGSERTVRIRQGSLLYEALGETEEISCWHHQAVKTPGEGLMITMYDEDDRTAEAFEHTELPVYGIQWHPEASSCGHQVIRAFLDEVREISGQESEVKK